MPSTKITTPNKIMEWAICLRPFCCNCRKPLQIFMAPPEKIMANILILFPVFQKTTRAVNINSPSITFTVSKNRSLSFNKLRICLNISYFPRVATITALMVCIRFSASSNTTSAYLSKTSSVTSFPFTAGRQ